MASAADPQQGHLEQGYMLGRSRQSSTRLTHQHLLWADHFGWSLHPSATKGWYAGGQGETEERRIADVACGNAIWTITESRAHRQTTKFVGLDISTAQFPPAISLAPNITLETYDMFQAPPEKYDSYFDVIHIRLVVGAVRADPLPVIRNLLQMLKPGGTLQWGEVKPLEVAIFPDSPATAHVRTKLEALWQQLLGPKNVDGTHRMDWVGALAGIFRASGLFEKGSVLEVNFGVPREGMWNYWSVNELGAMEEICKGIGRKDLVEAFEEIEALMAKEGVCLNYDPVVVVGRKK